MSHQRFGEERVHWPAILAMVAIMTCVVVLILMFKDEIDSMAETTPAPVELSDREKLDQLYELTVGDNDTSLLGVMKEVRLQLDDLCLELARVQNLSAFHCMDEPR